MLTHTAHGKKKRESLGTKPQMNPDDDICFEEVEPLQFLAQTLGQNRPKPLKSKRSRRELSNGVVESLIRRDLTDGDLTAAG